MEVIVTNLSHMWLNVAEMLRADVRTSAKTKVDESLHWANTHKCHFRTCVIVLCAYHLSGKLLKSGIILLTFPSLEMFLKIAHLVVFHSGRFCTFSSLFL